MGGYNDLTASHPIGIKDFYPVTVGILDKRQVIHTAILNAFLEFNA